jgi:hypothetical protein
MKELPSMAGARSIMKTRAKKRQYPHVTGT